MKCIILAAGYATRLYPLTENFPKPLLKVGEKTILDWLIDDIASTGCIDQFVVISNHRFASIFSDWGKSRAEDIIIVDDGTSTNDTRLGAVRDIQYAIQKLSINDDALVIAGDNLLDFSFKSFIDFAKSKDTSCIMTHEENSLEKQRKTGIITFDDNQLITSYEEKPQNPRSNHAVPPFYIYKSEDLKRIDAALDSGCGYDAPGSFAAWLSTQTALHAFNMPGKRYDIGDINSYEMVKAIYKGIL